MRNLPVHWSEGMFLRPQHFQAADRHWAEALATSDRWSTPFNYGLRRVEISPEALANYHFQVVGLEARLQSGALVSLATGEELERIDLKAALEAESELIVYLAVPKQILGRPNVVSPGEEPSGSPRRFASIDMPLQDQSSGGDDQDISLLQLQARLLLSTDDLQGYETLPLARVKRAGAEEAIPQIDEQYIPPLLAVDAWKPLAIDIVRAIYDILGEKLEVIAGRVAERGVTLASNDPGDLDDLLMLSSLNEAVAKLQSLTFCQGVHPFGVYRELCGAVGALSLFAPSRRVSGLPVYDHDDLAKIFLWIKIKIEQLLGSRKQLEYEQRYFQGAGRGMQVAIEAAWLHSSWEWYIGVNSENITEDACRELLRPGKLDWKMGSANQVDLIFKHGVPGIDHQELANAPRALPTHRGWSYYQIRREGNAWKDVLATQSLALRFRTELIGNLEELSGKQKLEVVLSDKRVVLQFALFAVPTSGTTD